MLPHPYTAIFLRELEYQERLRHVAQERLAASAQQRKPSLLASVRVASPVAAWLRGQLLSLRGQQRARSAPSLARDASAFQ